MAVLQQEQEPEAATDPDELAGPDDPGRDRRLAWAELMRRAYACDVLLCPRCGGPMRLVTLVQDAAVCERSLRHVGLWTRGPPRDDDGQACIGEPPALLAEAGHPGALAVAVDESA